MVFRILGGLWRLARRLIGYFLLLLLFLYGLQYSTYPINQERTAIAWLVRDHLFDYVTWEIDALATKTQQTLFGLQPFMSEADRSQFVRDYMADITTAQQLEAQVSAIYTSPDVTDPEAESADLRAERDQLRESLSQRQPLAEAILEGQVATVLAEQGFGTLGQLLPPISMHFTQVPNLLIISPRDEIRFEYSINVDPLPVDEMTAIENRIDQEEDVSSLIVPLGGIALYPAMIYETASIERAADIFAHEWLHHYFFAFPLGLSYDFAGEARIINETTANLFGQQIAPLVLQRYYPELAPAPTAGAQRVSLTQQTDDFDFGTVLDTTRRHVDELLAEDKVEEAETYMEDQRRLFVEHGYLIRKLNQAFFAFYGGYQSGEPGAGGSDPTGPAVHAILDASPSIHAWIVTMRSITTREELLRIRGYVAPQKPSPTTMR
ncbi:MAG: hypothetical protein K8L99_22725 [Anaerolineae bacterium]|nr:hypothetical protein [Anaerolineae bacterium]